MCLYFCPLILFLYLSLFMFISRRPTAPTATACSKNKIYNPNAATNLMSFFFCLFFSFFFGFSHFLSRVVFLLYIICFCFYFLITLQMRIYLGFSRLLFFVLCTYFICFFGVVSLAQPHFRIFRMKFLFGNFTRTRTRSCCSLFPLPFSFPFPFPIPLPFSFSFAFAFRLTAARQPLACLVVVSITVRSVRTCTYTHTHIHFEFAGYRYRCKKHIRFLQPKCGHLSLFDSLAHGFIFKRLIMQQLKQCFIN